MSSEFREPNDDATHEEVVKRVMMAGRENATNSMLFHQAIAHLLGLHVPDMRCLELISRHGPSNPSELARLTGLTTGSDTVLIDRLEKAGLIERKPDPKDRRKTILSPTRKAQMKIGPLYKPMAQGMFKLMSKYSRAELRALEKFFVETKSFWREEAARLTEKKSRKK